MQKKTSADELEEGLGGCPLGLGEAERAEEEMEGGRSACLRAGASLRSQNKESGHLRIWFNNHEPFGIIQTRGEVGGWEDGVWCREPHTHQHPGESQLEGHTNIKQSHHETGTNTVVWGFLSVSCFFNIQILYL